VSSSPHVQVFFVADEHDHHILVRRVLSSLLEPLRQMVESVPPGQSGLVSIHLTVSTHLKRFNMLPGDIVDKECTSSPTVVGSCDGSEGLLSRRVPDLQLDQLLFNGNHSRAEFNTNGKIVHGLETLVGELQEQAGLSNTCIPNDNVLEKVGVAHG